MKQPRYLGVGIAVCCNDKIHRQGHVLLASTMSARSPDPCATSPRTMRRPDSNQSSLTTYRVNNLKLSYEGANVAPGRRISKQCSHGHNIHEALHKTTGFLPQETTVTPIMNLAASTLVVARNAASTHEREHGHCCLGPNWTRHGPDMAIVVEMA